MGGGIVRCVRAFIGLSSSFFCVVEGLCPLRESARPRGWGLALFTELMGNEMEGHRGPGDRDVRTGNPPCNGSYLISP